MTNQQSQSQKPLVSQEVQDLEEEQLGEVAGGGGVKQLFRCCFGGSPTKESSLQPTQSQIIRVQHSFALRPGNLDNVADRTSISVPEYEAHKLRKKQEGETVAAFKQLPFHPQ